MNDVCQQGQTNNNEAGIDPLVLATRFADVFQHMRAEARFNLETFIRACEAGMGGTVVIQAPSTRVKRAVTEVRYVSEGFSVTSAA